MDFAGKHIVVVGGTSGIGEAVVSKLKSAGAGVTNIARRENSEVFNISLDVTSDFDTRNKRGTERR